MEPVIATKRTPGSPRGWDGVDPFDAAPDEGAERLARELFELEPVRRLRSIPGRETLLARWRGVSCVVKRTRGDLTRERWYERLRGRRGRSPGQREAENLQALAAAGVVVPRALAWVVDGARSAVAMEYVEHEEDLEQRLRGADAAARATELERLAELVARVHRLGFYHRDLYLSHLVLRPGEGEEELVLLDAGRVRRELHPRSRWFVKDLAALLHSRPPSVTNAEALRVLVRYLALRGESDRRRWAGRVLRKAARLGAHAPRHVDSTTHSPRP